MLTICPAITRRYPMTKVWLSVLFVLEICMQGTFFSHIFTWYVYLSYFDSWLDFGGSLTAYSNNYKINPLRILYGTCICYAEDNKNDEEQLTRTRIEMRNVRRKVFGGKRLRAIWTTCILRVFQHDVHTASLYLLAIIGPKTCQQVNES